MPLRPRRAVCQLRALRQTHLLQRLLPRVQVQMSAPLRPLLTMGRQQMLLASIQHWLSAFAEIARRLLQSAKDGLSHKLHLASGEKASHNP